MLKPNRNFVLLKEVQLEDKTTSGILLGNKNPTKVYEVVALGPTVSIPVEVGNKVVLEKIVGQPIKDTDGTEYTIVDDRGVIAVVED